MYGFSIFATFRGSIRQRPRGRHQEAIFAALANGSGSPNTCIPDPSNLRTLNWKQLEGLVAPASRWTRKMCELRHPTEDAAAKLLCSVINTVPSVKLK